MNYDHIFDQAIDRLHGEGRYRVFIDILRNKGAFPNARCLAGHNGPQPITVWCSNDYLAMGQHPKVIAAMEEALHDVGAGSGGIYVDADTVTSGGCGIVSRVGLVSHTGDARVDQAEFTGCLTVIEPMPDGRLLLGTVFGDVPFRVATPDELFDE